MDERELTIRRVQMGQGISGLAPAGMEPTVEAGWWLVLSGASSPDANMALIHRSDSDALSRVLQRVEDVGCPVLLMLAGEGKSLAGQVPAGWEDVGTMPIMTVVLAETPTLPDARVRRAGSDDIATLTELLAESYGMEPSVAAVMAAVAGRDEDLTMWILEQDHVAVSTGSTARVGDSVSVWAMGTPERFGRRGYGRALLAHVLHEAKQDGALVGLLGATPAGFPLYEAAGWHTVEEWQIYTNATSAQFSH